MRYYSDIERLVLFLVQPLIFVLGALLFYVSDSPIWLYFSSLISVLFSAAAVRFNPLHPGVWAVFAVFMYCSAIFVLSYLGWHHLHEMVRAAMISYVAYFSVAISIGFLSTFVFKIPVFPSQEIINDSGRHELGFVYLFLIASIFLVIVNNVIFISSGASSKREFWEFDGGSYFHAFYNVMIIFYAMYLILCVAKKAKISKLLIFAVATLSFLTVVNTGERDVLLKFLIATSFIFMAFKKIKVRYVYLSMLMVLIALPFLKQIGTSLHQGLNIELNRPLAVAVLQSDFQAAGRNLDYLLINESLYKNNRVQHLLTDLIRGVVPGFMYRVENTGVWFTSEYTPVTIGRDRAGIGFTLPGAFYVYGGIIGVAIGFFLYSLLAVFAYSRSANSALWLSGYTLLAPLLVWSMRGDLAYVLSSALKQVAVPILVYYVFSSFVLKVLRRSSKIPKVA